MEDYIFLYDLPREKRSLRVKINRMLHAIKSKKIQHSVWQSTSLTDFKKIKKLIERNSGQAIIMEKRLVD